MTTPKTFDCVDHNKLWNILNEMRIPDHLICLLRNLYEFQGDKVKTHGTMDWFHTGKGVHKCCILSSVYLTDEYIMQNARLDEAEAVIEILGEIPITSDMQMTLP